MKSKTARDKRGPTTRDDTEFSFPVGTPFGDKNEYLEKAIIFRILSIDLKRGLGFEGGDCWYIAVASDGRPEAIIDLGCNERRDAQMREAQAHIKEHGPIPNVRLKKSKAYYLETVKAEAR